MSARRKLNTSYFNGALIVGGLVGYATGSYWVFAAVAVLMVATSINNEDIRW